MVDVGARMVAGLSRPPATQAYEKYFLPRNPFPAPGIEAIFPMVNQESANGQVGDALLRFLTQTNHHEQAFRLLITSDYAGGKTHFLKHYLRVLDEISARGDIAGLRTVYIKNPDITIARMIARVLQELGGVDFLIKFVSQATEHISTSPNVAEFKRAAGSLKDLSGRQPGLDEDQGMGIETLQKFQILMKWLSGERCTEREKSYIGVRSVLEASTEVVDHFAEVVSAARRAGMFRLLVIAVDEFETISSRALMQRQRERYLLDLRHFLDTMPGSVMLVMASLSYVVAELREYAAILRRLEPRVELDLVQLDSARVWTARYLIDARKRWLDDHPEARDEIVSRQLMPPDNTSDDELEDETLWPLTAEDVRNAFEEVKLRNDQARPGVLLAELHHRLGAVVESTASATGGFS